MNSKFLSLQIAAKTEDVHIKLHHVAKVLGENYPQYNGLISQRQLKNGGLICTLNKFKECPPSERFANRCKFSIGKCILLHHSLKIVWFVSIFVFYEVFVLLCLLACASCSTDTLCSS